MIINITRFYNSSEEIINFFRDYGKMILYAAHKSKQNKTEGKRLKILTPKQMVQRLPIALAQVKAGNNSESLLNEIIIALSNLSIYYTWKNVKSLYNNKFKISTPTWNDKFELLDGSYSVSDIQDYFKYILKKHGEDIDKPSITNIRK